MAVSNGTWLSGSVNVGFFSGSQGTLAVAGGTNRFSSAFDIGSLANATGTVWLTGNSAQLVTTNNSLAVGSSGVGQMTVSNGTWLARGPTVGYTGGSQGTLTIAGGTNRLSSLLPIRSLEDSPAT